MPISDRVPSLRVVLPVFVEVALVSLSVPGPALTRLAVPAILLLMVVVPVGVVMRAGGPVKFSAFDFTV